MSTTIRPEVSEKNRYWIDRHRYYELKHFCLQYSLWKKAYASLDGMNDRPTCLTGIHTTNLGNPTEQCAMSKLFYLERIEMIERIAKKTDESLSSYILMGVTKGISYDHLKARFEIPCCKDTYYNLYRRFFWLLDKVRN